MSSNIIDANGIQIQVYADIFNDIVNGIPGVPGYIQIYGPDINVDSNTPDGQSINILVTSKLDVLQYILATYNSFDITQNRGVAIDGLAQLSRNFRQGGTYTQVPIVVNVTGSVSLNGLDTSNPYSISDNNSNIFNLLTSATLSNGDNTLTFQAANVGAVQVLPNTIVVPVTIIAGVNSVNNPGVASQQGENQETDSQFRIRVMKSTAKPSQGFNGSLAAGLLEITGVIQEVIYENDGGDTDLHGVPGHSIWVIVEGGSQQDIANTIYLYRNAGCGMKGDITINITQSDGSIFPVKFDIAIAQDLFVNLTVTSLSDGAVDIASLATSLANTYILGINQIADITSITALVKAINPDLLVQSAGVCATSMGSFVDSLLPTNLYNYWTLLSTNINITVD